MADNDAQKDDQEVNVAKDTVVSEEKVVLTPKELEDRLEAVRKDAAKKAAQTEKDKMYKTVAEKEDALKRAEKELEEFRKKDADLSAKAEEERKAKLTDQQRVDEELKKASAKVEQVETAFALLRKETSEQIKKKDLEVLREKIIADAGGKIIPELVTGNSIEELEASSVKAVSRYEEITANATKGLQKPSVNQSSNSHLNETPNQTRMTSPEQEKPVSAEEVRNMDAVTFQQRKEEILKKYGV